MFQALRDTGQPPHHCDWICLARGGRDAKNFTVRGVYRVGKRYQALDIVSKNGGSFIARCDDPGECPGDGWANLTCPANVAPKARWVLKGIRAIRVLTAMLRRQFSNG